MAVLPIVISAGAAAAATISPFQSTARPQGSEIAGPVQLAGSDDRAATFQQEVLPTMFDAARQDLGENQVVDDLGALALDTSRMVVSDVVVPRIYFVWEGAGFHNSLLAQVIRADGTVEDESIIFPDASSAASWWGGYRENGGRSASTPLLAGDFVDLDHQLNPGDRLTLQLLANGANGGSSLFSTDPSRNVDGLDQHVVGLLSSAPSAKGFVLMGFEDLWGGSDQDYNDVILAVDFGEANTRAFEAQQIPGVPLPLPAASLVAAIGLLAAIRRRSARG
ncbi:DUF4114 domain-containing protein [Sulfitobacter sp. D35]|uniref:DUF4114 domain-containing protein n=1 Tax=Sulfitobacter sp. D35 TaxID=3083252 RepID=UPI00296E962C|nr:DUF4114 domain-containing protein [Sulfitobacter sp. D35]MDW4500455.1 DUF4114 domain-containing protein [Sulfitobacter sp. D35]